MRKVFIGAIALCVLTVCVSCSNYAWDFIENIARIAVEQHVEAFHTPQEGPTERNRGR